MPGSQDESRGLERWFYSDWLNAKWFRTASAKRAKSQARAEAAMAADALDEKDTNTSAASSDAEAEECRDSEPNFWSLDNPVVATGALLGAMVLLAVLQR